MKRLIFLLAASALATTPAIAQHAGHDPHAGHRAPAKKAPSKKPAAKKAAAKKASTKKATTKKKPSPKNTVKKAPAKKPAAKSSPKAAVDPHAGHQVPAEPAKVDPGYRPFDAYGTDGQRSSRGARHAHRRNGRSGPSCRPRHQRCRSTSRSSSCRGPGRAGECCRNDLGSGSDEPVACRPVARTRGYAGIQAADRPTGNAHP